MFEPLANAQVTARYRLVREIGRGGMGSVWEAHDSELDAPCALKFILNQEAKPPEVRLRFLREARAVARLHSPHAVGIRGVGEWEGALYIAMELLVGETLFSRLTRGPLSAGETSRVIEQLGSVLTMAHRAGFVHRDLKPENVWLCGDDANPRNTSNNQLIVKLLDFGVAKQVLDRDPMLKTASGLLVGTPYYMSPEQAGNRELDYRSDLWSLAVIALECLTGKRVFDAPALYELLDKIVRGPAPKLLELYPGASPSLVAWWSRATAKAPQERHGSAAELADEFSSSLLELSSAFVAARASLGSTPASNSALPATADGQRGPMTLTTPGDIRANPWAGTAVPAVTESVGPLSSTHGHETPMRTDRSAKRRVWAKFAWLVPLATALVGIVWWVTQRSGETEEVSALATAGASASSMVVTSQTSAPAFTYAPNASAVTALAVEITAATSARRPPDGTSPPSAPLAPTLPNALAKTAPAVLPKPAPLPSSRNVTSPVSKASPTTPTKPAAPPKRDRSGL